MKPFIIGIAGGSGVGKVHSRAKRHESASHRVGRVPRHGRVLPQFRAPAAAGAKKINWDHPDAFDWELLVSQLASLATGDAIEKPTYDFVTHTRSDQTVVVPPAQVVVIDGILLFTDPRVRDLCDVKVFVDADADIRLIRRIRRGHVQTWTRTDGNPRPVSDAAVQLRCICSSWSRASGTPKHHRAEGRAPTPSPLK